MECSPLSNETGIRNDFAAALTPTGFLGVGIAPLIEHPVVKQVAALPLNLFLTGIFFLHRHPEGLSAGSVITDVPRQRHEDRLALGYVFTIVKATQKDDASLYTGVIVLKSELWEADNRKQLKVFQHPVPHALQ